MKIAPRYLRLTFAEAHRILNSSRCDEVTVATRAEIVLISKGKHLTDRVSNMNRDAYIIRNILGK